MKAFENESFAQNYDRFRRPPEACLTRYESVVRKEADRLLAKGGEFSCFDVGAGAGTYSLMLEKAVPPVATLVALEPAEAMKNQLVAFLEGRRWQVRQAGLPLPIPEVATGLAWISDVLHLFPTAEVFAQSLAESLPNLDTVAIRLHLSDTITKCEWKAYFPTAFAADKVRHPSPEALIASFRNIGYLAHEFEVVDESFDLPTANYISYFDKRSFSGLHLLSQSEFDEGMKVLRDSSQLHETLRRVIWRAIFVFRKEEH
jgi:SAM-dependent methyltransferase